LGILTGKDIYSSKYITADITDAAHKVHFVPIKYVLGDYFLADVNNRIYLFKIDGGRIFTWEKTLAKSFRKIYYNTSHIRPISPEDTKAIELLLKENKLPNIDKNLYGILRLLGLNEELKEGEKPRHSLSKLSEQVATISEKNPEEAANLMQYIKNLGIEREVVTPVRKIGEFIERDLLETSPGFLGDVIAHYQRTDIEHRKVMNRPYGIKKPWMLIIGLLMIVMIVIVAILYLFQSGGLEGIIPGLPGAQDESADIMAKYNTPEELEEAISKGELDFDELPKDIRSMLAKFREAESEVTATPKT